LGVLPTGEPQLRQSAVPHHPNICPDIANNSLPIADPALFRSTIA
jgi:hypothetical protein